MGISRPRELTSNCRLVKAKKWVHIFYLHVSSVLAMQPHIVYIPWYVRAVKGGGGGQPIGTDTSGHLGTCPWTRKLAQVPSRAAIIVDLMQKVR